MKTIKAVFLLMLFVFFGCNISDSNDTQESNKINNNKEISLIIEATFSGKSSISVETIDKVTNYEKFSIVDYTTTSGISTNIIIKDLYDKFGNFNRGGGVTINCFGDENCHCLLTSPDGINFHCTCPDCKMKVVNTKNQSVSELSNEYLTKINIEKYILESYLRTFDKKINFNELKIDNLIMKKSSDVDIYTIIYKDLSGNQSSLMVLDYKDDLQNRSGGGDVVVDCFGTCDCRESYNTNTGEITCTCNECKMKITPIE